MATAFPEGEAIREKIVKKVVKDIEKRKVRIHKWLKKRNSGQIRS